MAKPEFEFFPVTDVKWTVCPWDDPKITERILAKDPEGNVATRILRYEPGADSTPMGVQKHDFWEEVYILEGSFTDLTLGETFTAGMYACGRGYAARPLEHGRGRCHLRSPVPQ